MGISEDRIVGADDDAVVFRYRKVNSQRQRTMALAPAEFIRRFLQHVLPTGFMKVRYFGFLSPSFSMSIEEVKARIELAHGFTVAAPADADGAVSTAHPMICCAQCGGKLIWRSVLLPRPLGSRALAPAYAAGTATKVEGAMSGSG